MTAPNGLTQPPNPDSSITASGTTQPVAPAPPPAPAAEFRFGPEAEPWMQGKTPAEVTAQARQLATLAAQALQQPPPAAQTPAPSAELQIDPNDYLTGANAIQLGQHWQNQTLGRAEQMMSPALNMMANTSLELVKREYPEEFAKYAPEILGRLQHVPKTGWSIDNIRQVVKLSQADHLDELIHARAAKLNSQDPALRSTGAPGAPLQTQPIGPDAQLSEGQRAHLRRNGMTPELIAQMAARSGKTAQEWYALYAKHSVGDAL